LIETLYNMDLNFGRILNFLRKRYLPTQTELR